MVDDATAIDDAIGLFLSGAKGVRGGNRAASVSPSPLAVDLPNVFAGAQLTSGGLRVRLVGAAVRLACARRGWSLARLATESGLSRPTVSAAARGCPTTVRSAYRLCRALGILG